MATLYFYSLAVPDWSLVTNWYTNQAHTIPAGRIPNSTDTAVILSNLSVISGAYVDPAILQIGLPDASNFLNFNPTATLNIPLVNVYYSLFVNDGGSYTLGTLNLYGATTGGTYNVTTANLYATNSGGYVTTNIYGTANFYTNSSNGSGDNNDGYVFGVANFYNNSQNANGNAGAEDGNSGFVFGNANFYDTSANAAVDFDGDLTGSASGRVFGTATFHDNAGNGYCNPLGGGCAIGTASNIVYTNSNPFNTDLRAIASASSISAPAYGGGGITKTNILLTELLKIPFPITL
jgi:hypothetical protein